MLCEPSSEEFRRTVALEGCSSVDEGDGVSDAVALLKPSIKLTRFERAGAANGEDGFKRL